MGDGDIGCPFVEHAEYMRAWRAKRGAVTGRPGRRRTAPCGTRSAYKRHIRLGEPVDAACAAANAAYSRERWNAKKAHHPG